MKRLLLLLLLAIVAPAPGRAQTLAQVAAKADTLAMVIGDFKTVVPCDKLEALRPATWLPDGQYPERYRLKQIGCAIDAAVAMVAQFAVTVNTVNARIDALAVQVAQLAVSPAPGGSIGNVVNGDLIVNGRICMYTTCPEGTPQGIFATAQKSFAFSVRSNADGQNSQGAERHCSSVTFGQDGGVRTEHNVEYVGGGANWCEPAKPRTIQAFDSRGTFSISQDFNGVIEPSQLLILRYDRDRGYAALTTMKPNVKHCLGWSSAVNDYSNLYCPVSGNSARPPRALGASAPLPVYRGLFDLR